MKHRDKENNRIGQKEKELKNEIERERESELMCRACLKLFHS